MQIQHIALADSWTTAQKSGTYTVSTLGRDLADVGFIHCSRPEQLDDVFRHFYAGVTEPLLLLTVDTDLLTSPWQFDDVPGERLSFPHIYGPLNLDAVVAADPLRSSASS
jgi:uncharacterized protein (DUF952 family)